MKALEMLVAAALLVAGASALAQPLPIPGTGAAEEPLRRLAAEFNLREKAELVTVPSSTGSSGGIKAVIEGRAVVARVARPLKESEAKDGLSYLPFARDAVVMAVGEAVPARGLSGDQVAAIWRGELTNWSQAGGGNAPIRVLVREPSDANLQILRQTVHALARAEPSSEAKLVNHDYEMVELLDKYPTSIGYLPKSALAAAKTRAAALALDGVEPTPENIENGRYPAVIEFAFVFKEGRLDTTARRFLDFVFSPEGQRVLRGGGAIGVGRR